MRLDRQLLNFNVLYFRFVALAFTWTENKLDSSSKTTSSVEIKADAWNKTTLNDVWRRVTLVSKREIVTRLTQILGILEEELNCKYCK